jgi:hypothetical protein
LQRLQVSQSTPIQFLSFELPKVKRVVQIPQFIHHDLRELAPEYLHAMLSSFNKHTSQDKWAADLPAEARALRSSLHYGSRP